MRPALMLVAALVAACDPHTAPADKAAPAAAQAPPSAPADEATSPASALASPPASDPAPARSPAPSQGPAAPLPKPTVAASPPPPEGRTSTLDRDEELRLFPGLARPVEGGWEVTLRAWVFEPEADSWRRKAAVEALRAALDLPADATESAIFRERAAAVRVDHERGEEVIVEIGGTRHALAHTAANGQSETTLLLADAAITCPTTPVRALLRPGDARRFEGALHCLDPGSRSVVSDIDDTIKVSEVRDKDALLRNTFLREAEAVPGLAAVYRAWADAGARFHYVSASPWQLDDTLSRFMERAGFPAGTHHLKSFRWKDSTFFALFQDPEVYKRAILEPLLRAAPGRRFVLVGDSGERDPEIYGALARDFPDQVDAIYIRDVTGEPADADRYRSAFAGVPAQRWALFHDAAELPGPAALARR